MLALRLESLAIRAERGQYGRGLPASDACENWLVFPEAPARARIAGSRLGKLLQRVLWRGSFGFEQCIEDRLDLVHAMDLKAAHFERGHLGKCAHLRGVAGNKFFNELARGGFLVSGFAPRDNQRSSHALQIPLECPANGLVKIVDVEDQSSIRRGKGAQVAHVSVTAKLADNSGRGQNSQIGGHYGYRAAQVAEGRLRHQPVLERNERGNSPVHRARYKFQRGSFPRLGFEFVVLLAANLLAPCLPQIAPFFRARPLHEPQDTPLDRATQAVVRVRALFAYKSG